MQLLPSNRLAEPLDSLFREAVCSMDAGDDADLTRLLATHPRLVHDRLDSPGAWLRDVVGDALEGFFKQPYLLWFLANDPVRNAELPGNIAQLSRTIIRAAKREGVDSLREQLDYTLHLAVCSPTGRESGLQLELIDVLIDAGASTQVRTGEAGGAAVQALICRNIAAAEHLIERGAELTFLVAVCLERWDDVADLGRTVSIRDKQIALALAALNGNSRGLVMLIDFGVDLNAYATGFYTHATPLHHAVSSSSSDAVRVLVEAGAELGTRDTAWNGTPLGWARYYQSAHEGDGRARRYAAIAAYLRDSGASDD